MVTKRIWVRTPAGGSSTLKTDEASACSCGCMLLILLCNLLLGGICTDYSLWFYFGIHIPFVACIVIGLFLGQFAVPLAVIAWVLHLCGVAAPLIHR